MTERRSCIGRDVSAIVIDGSQNALSVARSLAGLGARVYCLSEPNEPVRYSKGVTRIAEGGANAASWERFLLGPESEWLRGSLLLACSDQAIEFLAKSSAELSKKFVLEEGDPETRLLLLDKFRTYRHAREAGIPTVKFQYVKSFSDMKEACGAFEFPVVLKPIHSPDADRLGGKIVIANDEYEFLRLAPLLEKGVQAVAMEFIPGGDDQLCSYYAYLDEKGDALAEFTKRVVRRSPIHTGSVSYHVTDWNAEAAALGRRLFASLKLRGVGNVEFKRDPRDGRLKIIEVNARFTLGDPLLVRSGVDLTAITVARLTGQPTPPRADYEKGLVLWIPMEDFRTFLQLRRRKEISWGKWLGEISRARVFPYFSWRDPEPSLRHNIGRAIFVLNRWIRRARRALTLPALGNRATRSAADRSRAP
jgi:D-aspartate ligase